MIKKLREGFIPELKALARKYNSLNVELSLNYSFDINLEEKQKIIMKIIKPLFVGSKSAYLYSDGEHINYENKLSSILYKKGKKYEFDLKKNIFNGMEEFWGNELEERGAITWENCVDALDLKEILKHTYDPFVLTNLGASLSRSAITMAKKMAAIDERKIFFGLSSHGLKWLTIFVNHNKIDSLVDLALDSCQLSDSYLMLYGHRNSI